MILSMLLSIVFVFMALYSAVFVRRIAVRYLLIFSYAAAIFFVWFPDTTTIIANIFGIGRGLDFVVVLLLVTAINGMFFMIKHMVAQHQSITKLARHIALRDARAPRRQSDELSVHDE